MFHVILGGSSTSSSDIEDISYSSDDFSSEEESVIMLSYPDHQMPRSISAISLGADVQSICSQNQSEYIKIIEDNDMKKVLKEVRGCLIHRCRITQSKGAVMVALQAHAVISNCDINSVGYGIRCIQNSRVRFIHLPNCLFITLNKKQLKSTAFKVLRSFFLFSSPCQRQCELLPSLGVRRPLTFHILIFSSETPQPN